MFYDEGYILRSDIFDGFDTVRHGFATRAGGVSVDPALASMNFVVRFSESENNVRENVKRLCGYAGLEGTDAVFGKQIHSNIVVLASDADRKISSDLRSADGYVTDKAGLSLLVKTADCVPILLAGKKEDGSAVVGAVHAGWRGTVTDICVEAVKKMLFSGTVRESIKVAVGPSICEDCFEVQEDFFDNVKGAKGLNFAEKHIRKRDGKLFASLREMNREILCSCGVPCKNIDITTECTCHNPKKYHSHRATNGKRGVGGGIIGIRGGENDALF